MNNSIDSKKLIKKCIIVNAYGHSNRGDSVLLDECIKDIQLVYPDSEVGCLLFENSEIDKTKIIQYERLGNRPKGWPKISSLLIIFIAIVSSFGIFGFMKWCLPKEQRRSFEAIKNSDIVISSPGGYIHDTNFAYWIAVAHIFIGVILKKKVLLAPQSIGPISNNLARSIVGRILNKVDAICPRESYSELYLVNMMGVSKKIVYRTGDSAFWNNEVYRDSNKLDHILEQIGIKITDKFIGLTVVGWTFPGKENPKKYYENYVNFFSLALDEIYKKIGLPFVVFNQVTDDLPTAYLIKEKCKAPVYVDEISRPPQILRGLISKSTYFIGTRFHSCIFAIIEKKPLMAIAYLPKTSYIMQDLKMGERWISIDDVKSNIIAEKVLTDFNNINEAGEEIDKKLKIYKETYGNFINVLKNI